MPVSFWAAVEIRKGWATSVRENGATRPACAPAACAGGGGLLELAQLRSQVGGPPLSLGDQACQPRKLPFHALPTLPPESSLRPHASARRRSGRGGPWTSAASSRMAWYMPRQGWTPRRKIPSAARGHRRRLPAPSLSRSAAELVCVGDQQNLPLMLWIRRRVFTALFHTASRSSRVASVRPSARSAAGLNSPSLPGTDLRRRPSRMAVSLRA